MLTFLLTAVIAVGVGLGSGQTASLSPAANNPDEAEGSNSGGYENALDGSENANDGQDNRNGNACERGENREDGGANREGGDGCETPTPASTPTPPATSTATPAPTQSPPTDNRDENADDRDDNADDKEDKRDENACDRGENRNDREANRDDDTCGTATSTPTATPMPTPAPSTSGGSGGGSSASTGAAGGGFSGMSSGEAANFEIVMASLNPSRVDPGETSTASVRVENTGTTGGTYRVELFVDGVYSGESRLLTIPAGGQDLAVFSRTFETPGSYVIDANGYPVGTLVVEAPSTPVPSATPTAEPAPPDDEAFPTPATDTPGRPGLEVSGGSIALALWLTLLILVIIGGAAYRHYVA